MHNVLTKNKDVMILNSHRYGVPGANDFKYTNSVAALETITVPAGGVNNFVIDWGDGSPTEVITTPSPSHEYTLAGSYQISISGIMPSFAFINGGNRLNVLSIDQIGSTGLTGDGVSGFAQGCSNCTIINTLGWDSSQITSFSKFADSCSSLVSLDFSTLDTSNSTTFVQFVRNCSSLAALNVPNLVSSACLSLGSFAPNCGSLPIISTIGWDTSNVTNMSFMFNNNSGLTDILGFELLDVSSCANFAFMCAGVTLPTSRYDDVLRLSTGWISRGIIANTGNMHFGNSQYTLSDPDVVNGRNAILALGKTITDGGGI